MSAKTHGMTGTPEYWAWKNILRRCHSPKTKGWHNYGGRGIEARFKSFEEFFAEVGPKPSPELSIDRIDNDGHYQPGNVRWATRAEQMSNRRTIFSRTLQPHCPRGHAYTPENSLQPEDIRNGDSKRLCKQCYKEYRRRKARRKNVKRFAKDRLNTAVRRYIKRFGGVTLLNGLPPLIPHDSLPLRWPATAETALILAQKVAAQYG